MFRKYAPPLAQKTPLTFFCAKSCRGIFIPCISPLPEEDLSRSLNIEIKFIIKSLSRLLLKCLPRTWTARSNDVHASYLAEAPCFLAPCYLCRDVYSSSILLHNQIQGLRGGMAVQKRTQHPQNLPIIFNQSQACGWA